jgi:molybdopterin molybdotransferase
MRARVDAGQVTVFERQDSALLSVLSQANALAVRAPGDGPRLPGDRIEIIAI